MANVLSYTQYVSLQEFQSVINDFMVSFAESPKLYLVSKAIVDTLLEGIYLPVDHPENPISVYDKIKDPIQLESILNSVVANKLPTDLRSLLVGFFHDGGFYKDDCMDVLDAFYNHADTCLDRNQTFSDSDSDSDSDNEDPCNY
jgi:hypothetical protein